jgi:hypothetical protein
MKGAARSSRLRSRSACCAAMVRWGPHTHTRGAQATSTCNKHTSTCAQGLVLARDRWDVHPPRSMCARYESEEGEVSASTSLGYAHTGRATAQARPPQPRQTTSAAMGPRSNFSRQRAGLQSRIFICDISSRWWVSASDFDDPWDASCNRVSSASSRTGTAVTSIGINVYDERPVGCPPPWTDVDPGPV